MISSASASTKRLIAGGGLLLAVLAVVLLGLGASGDGGGGDYRVRAIFDTASFLVPGEDVKIAGVKVGAIESLDVTRNRKAAVVLRIDDPAFKDFRRDATCTIRLQSLIGEKFVACTPTEPKGANSPQVPPLHRISGGPSKGQYLLPVTQTSSPVDVDLLSDIMRLPERERFRIIIGELGAGLSGNGAELRRVIRRADPALFQLDRVLKVLAPQNRVLARLATEGDASLIPLARESERIKDFIDGAGQTASATAERGDQLEANFARFPAFLRELTPTARRLGEFAAAGTPVMTDLRAAAPSVNRLFAQLGPFSEAALPTFRTLGDLSDASRRALTRSQPIIRDIGGFAKEARPFARILARGLTDLQQKKGIERLLDVILYTTGTANGFDSVSHFLRSYLFIPGQCLQYDATPTAACRSTFAPDSTSSSATAASTAVTGDVPATSLPSGMDVSSSSGAHAAPPVRGGPTSGLLGYLLGSDG